MMPEAPSAWSPYLGTTDVDALAASVAAAGETVVMPAMTVGEQGRMGVFQDPSGAFFGAWQPEAMAGFETVGPGAYAWAELNARGFEAASDFYGTVRRRDGRRGDGDEPAEMMSPTPFPGGRFAILTDPQGASFAIRQAG